MKHSNNQAFHAVTLSSSLRVPSTRLPALIGTLRDKLSAEIDESQGAAVELLCYLLQRHITARISQSNDIYAIETRYWTPQVEEVLSILAQFSHPGGITLSIGDGRVLWLGHAGDSTPALREGRIVFEEALA